MAIKYLRPDALKGSNADDDYLRTVLKYGDTTEYTSHLKACKQYGVLATFSQKGTKDTLLNELNMGFLWQQVFSTRDTFLHQEVAVIGCFLSVMITIKASFMILTVRWITSTAAMSPLAKAVNPLNTLGRTGYLAGKLKVKVPAGTCPFVLCSNHD
jgi:hypothetical protein